MFKHTQKAISAPGTHLVSAVGLTLFIGATFTTFPTEPIHQERVVIPLELSARAAPASDKPVAKSPVIHPANEFVPFTLYPLERKAPSSGQIAARPDRIPFELYPADISSVSGQLAKKPPEQADNIAQKPIAETPQPVVSVTPESVTQVETTLSEQAAKESLSKTVTIKNNDTLAGVFSDLGIPSATLYQILDSDKKAKQFSSLKVGQELEFVLAEDGSLARMATSIGPLKTLAVERVDNGFATNVEVIKPDVQVAYAHSNIQRSLLLDAQKAEIPRSIAFGLADLFAYDIDFAKDIIPGDEFDLMYENKVVDDRRVGTGHILAARFTNRGKTYTAIRYTDSNGIVDYLDENGATNRKAFIRTPVEFARISSRFSSGRRHPVLNRIRAHKGVDYAAPTGTPIMAAGNGVVTFVGKKSGYGNIVILKHGPIYQTFYGHMHKFAKGMRTGKSVNQGEVIGYVGMTGLATGPHLHYEFRVNGQAVDPLSHKLPPPEPLSEQERQRFLTMSKPILAKMEKKRNELFATN